MNMRAIHYRESNPACTQQAITAYALKTGGIPPPDYVEFVLTDNGGRLADEFVEYTVPSKFPDQELFTDKGYLDVQSLLGMGLSGALNIDSLEWNEETIRFCEIDPSCYWMIAHGCGNDGFIMNVSRDRSGQIDYCFFDTGEHFPISDSFSDFINGLHAFSADRLDND